jgi:hypothetical protein
MIAILVAWMVLIGLPPFSAEDAAEVAGAECRLGCIVGEDGWVSELDRRDVEWLARAVECEAGVYGEWEQSAVAWALAQQLYQWHRRSTGDSPSLAWHHRREGNPSLATVVQSYSSCCSQKWATGGSAYHERITARADYYRNLDWGDIPARSRVFTVNWIEGRYPNETPGIVWWLAHGFEEHAPRETIGPFYVEGPENRGNVYFKIKPTVFWKTWTVRLVPATQEVTL